MKKYKHHFCSTTCYIEYRRRSGYPNKSNKNNLTAQRKIKYLADLRRKKIEGNSHKSVSDVEIS